MVMATWTAGIALLVIGGWCARGAVAEARGLDRVVALSNVFFAMPLAVFGAEHLAGDKGILSLVPAYMPWRLFWFYFVGAALVAAALSIAARVLVRWSGLLVGVLMFLFVAMLHFPGALSEPHNRIGWVIVFRESSFGGGGWALAGAAVPGWGPRTRSALVTVGRVLIALAAIFFGVQHFLHPLNVPGVPLAEGPARLDSGARDRGLPDGSDSARVRRGHPRGEEDSSAGHVSRDVDRAAGGVHLRPDADSLDARSEHGGESRGGQLFRGHPAVRGGNSELASATISTPTALRSPSSSPPGAGDPGTRSAAR